MMAQQLTQLPKTRPSQKIKISRRIYDYLTRSKEPKKELEQFSRLNRSGRRSMDADLLRWKNHSLHAQHQTLKRMAARHLPAVPTLEGIPPVTPGHYKRPAKKQ